MDGRAIEAFAILHEDLGVREDVNASVDNDRIELKCKIRHGGLTDTDVNRECVDSATGTRDRRAGNTKGGTGCAESSETILPCRSVPDES
jgi:hypothetical protein